MHNTVDDAEWTQVYHLNPNANDSTPRTRRSVATELFDYFLFVLRGDRVIRSHFMKPGDDTSPHSSTSGTMLVGHIR